MSRWRTHRVKLLGGLTGVVVVGIAAGLTLWLTDAFTGGRDSAGNPVPAAWQRPIVGADRLPERSGVAITRVAVTGDGGLVDLRFAVVDPDLANALHNEGTPPAVVDEKTGLVIHELFMNHAHTGVYQAGVTYYLVFNNPGNWIHRGSRVSVLLGNAQVEHVRVV